MHTMRDVGSGGIAPFILNLGIQGGREWSASPPRRVIPRELAAVTSRKIDWLGPRADLETKEKISCSYRELNYVFMVCRT